MISGLGYDEGCAESHNLPVRLAERAARVTDDPLQMSLISFDSPESRALCLMCRQHMISEREIRSATMLEEARGARS